MINPVQDGPSYNSNLEICLISPLGLLNVFRWKSYRTDLWFAISSTNKQLTPCNFQQKFKQILEDLIGTGHLNWSKEMLYSKRQHLWANFEFNTNEAFVGLISESSISCDFSKASVKKILHILISSDWEHTWNIQLESL